MTADFQITVMTEKDLEGVLAIEKDSFPTPWSRALFLQEFDLSFSRHFVFSRHNSENIREIIGYIVFWIIHDEFQLQRIAVKKSIRCRGIGSLLLKEMIRICRHEGVLSGSLEVRSGNTPAMMLYLKFGFNDIGLRKGYYTDTHEDAIVMGFNIKRNSQ